MHITKVITRDLPPVRNVTIECDERVNLFTGPNSSGKSTILRGIMGLHSLKTPTRYDDFYDWFETEDPTEYYRRKLTPPVIGRVGRRRNPNIGHSKLSLWWDWSAKYTQSSSAFSSWLTNVEAIKEKFEKFFDKFEAREKDFDFAEAEDFAEAVYEDSKDNIWDLVPFLYIPATRVNLPGQHVFKGTIEDPENIKGVDPLECLFDTESGTFDGRYLELALNWLRERMSENPYQREQFNKALALAIHASGAYVPR